MTEIEKEIQKLQKRITELENKLYNVQNIVEEIEKDIYLDEDLDAQEDTINCPYCDCEIAFDYDENLKEVQCPECQNTIELDWNGGEDENNSGCGGHCSSCDGCNNEEEK